VPFSEEPVTFRFLTVLLSLFILASASLGQADGVVGQISNSGFEAFAGGISGDGRFVVFESRGNLATENPRNSDNNTEIFLFDYAQRRIFQITDTKSVLKDPNGGTGFANIRVEIVNTRPVISNDGRWLAFSSNATIAYPGDDTNPPVVSSTNPGSFDGNAYNVLPTPLPNPAPTPTNVLTRDANLEMWMYEIPANAPVSNLSTGEEIPFVDLSGGTFIRVTNTVPSQLPRAATANSGAFVADDNHDASIDDDGSTIAFVSTRNLVPCVGNSFPLNEDNDEIFTFTRGGAVPCPTGADPGLNQVTKTPRGPISNPIYSKYPTISGNGLRVSFASTGDNPIVGMTGGNNPLSSRNEEIFYSDLLPNGAPGVAKVQVTVTTPTNPAALVNIYDIGRRMSRDGRYIAFDSYADLANENAGTNYTSFATYIFDTTTTTFRRVLPRSDADSAALGGDVARYPGFTDTNNAGTPSTLVLETRMNINAAGTMATGNEGLNPDPIRPVQVYKYTLSQPPAAATFTRIGKFPVPNTFLASTQPLPSNTSQRMAFNFALGEFGTQNLDLQSEVYYLLAPAITSTSPISATFATGATRLPISMSPVPTPSPTATPTPSPTPTPTGSPTPTPAPPTPPAVQGLAPGMLAILNFQVGFDPPIVARQGVGSIQRAFSLPIELSGVSMSINGAACGLKYVSRHRIDFVVPPGLTAATTGTTYPLVLINNGAVHRTTVTLVPARPDVFTLTPNEGPGGRAKVFNVTNRVFRTEPFPVRTIRTRPFGFTPTRLRVYATGVANVQAANIRIRLGTAPSTTGVTIVGNPVLVEPGVYAIDFTLPPDYRGIGDQPLVLSVDLGGAVFFGRLDDSASRVFIL
jgi:uncharacterized protein (TIGR03437 family)